MRGLERRGVDLLKACGNVGFQVALLLSTWVPAPLRGASAKYFKEAFWVVLASEDDLAKLDTSTRIPTSQAWRGLLRLGSKGPAFRPAKDLLKVQYVGSSSIVIISAPHSCFSDLKPTMHSILVT